MTTLSAISQYQQAARLKAPTGTLDTAMGNGGSTPSGAASSAGFKDTLGSAVSGMYDQVKHKGTAAESHITQQIMGTGNVEQTAVSLAELQTNLEVLAQGLRIAVEKITELTTRTMGG